MIGDKIQKAMNEQIKNELESYYIYLSMAAYFHSQNLDGMAHWMRCQSHEETTHAMKFFDHIIDRGGEVTLLDLKQIKTTWNSPLEAWQDAYAHEQFITGKINDLRKVARETRHMPASFINKAGNDVTKAFVEYARPIVGELPVIGRFKAVPVKKA